MGKYERNQPAKTPKNRSGIVVACVVVVAAVVAFGILAAILHGRAPAAQSTLMTEQQEDNSIVASEESMTVLETEETVPVRRELTVAPVEQQDEMMILNTSYGTIKYPFAFSDLIQVEPVNGETYAAMKWLVCIGEEEYPLFTLTFNGDAGILIGTMMIEPNLPAEPVYVQFFEADKDWGETVMGTFYAAQEVFNDVVTSLEENEAFTPAN